MNAQHTQGPWYIAADAEGTMTTDSNGAQITMWPPQGGTVEQCANARLIAAAPDLLVALQMVDRIWSNDQTANLDPESPLAIVRAAIAKATGEKR